MNDKTLHLRQIHPNFIDQGQVSSQAFTPFPKDEGKLSVYDGDQISPVAAYTHYTEVLQFQSDGVWAVTGSEITSMGLVSESAPLENFVEHALIDFNPHSQKTARKLAKKLRDIAVERGCLHIPEDK